MQLTSPLNTTEALVVVGLFALALVGFLVVANKPGKITKWHVLNTLGFVALVVLDVVLLIKLTP